MNKYFPIKNILTCIIFIIFPSLLMNSQPLPNVVGQIVRHENFQSQFITPRNVDVWLPENYSNKQKYAVLYMHDGQMLFDETKTWNGQEWDVDGTVSQLINQQKIPNCIVVSIWNGGNERWSDYYPQKPYESLSQDFIKKFVTKNGTDYASVNSDNYLKFLVTELKPFIDKEYPTKTDMGNTFVAGSSMGGLISMYAICEYPGTFGGAACLSTHWIGASPMQNNPMPDTFVAYLKSKLPNFETHKIYFDYGTATLDAHYEPHQKRIDQVMQQGGYNETNWKTLKFEGANHSENAWRSRLHLPLEFIMNR